MRDRKQERLGWLGGWLGGFIWVLILSVVFLFQGRGTEAGIGLLIVSAAVVTIFLGSPWRYPQTSYRKLMLPVYALFFVAVAWGVWTAEDLGSFGFTSPWSALILLPILLPLWTVGSRRWEDGTIREDRPG